MYGHWSGYGDVYRIESRKNLENSMSASNKRGSMFILLQSYLNTTNTWSCNSIAQGYIYFLGLSICLENKNLKVIVITKTKTSNWETSKKFSDFAALPLTSLYKNTNKVILWLRFEDNNRQTKKMNIN